MRPYTRRGEPTVSRAARMNTKITELTRVVNRLAAAIESLKEAEK